MFWFLFVSSCVVCFYFRHLTCMILCLCCLVTFFFKTGLSRFVVCILWFSFLFCCFVLKFVFSCFSFLSKKTQNGHSENQKKQNAEKNGQTKKTISAIVFTNSVPIFWGVGKNMQIFAENTIKIVVSTYFEK